MWTLACPTDVELIAEQCEPEAEGRQAGSRFDRIDAVGDDPLVAVVLVDPDCASSVVDGVPDASKRHPCAIDRNVVPKRWIRPSQRGRQRRHDRLTENPAIGFTPVHVYRTRVSTIVAGHEVACKWIAYGTPITIQNDLLSERVQMRQLRIGCEH